MSLELKIVNLPENKQVKEEDFGSWKFVLAQEDNTILFYAGAQPKKDDEYSHSRVIDENNISLRIIGGGDICFHYGTLDIDGMSGNYGIVPNSVMEEFAKMIVEQNSIKHSVKKVKIDMGYDPGESEEKNPEHCEMWKKLGYEFDNRKRVLEL